MITPEEKAEKIRQAPSNSGRWKRTLSQEKREEASTKALYHDKDAGLSSSDSYAYHKQKERARAAH